MVQMGAGSSGGGGKWFRWGLDDDSGGGGLVIQLVVGGGVVPMVRLGWGANVWVGVVRGQRGKRGRG